MADLLSGVPGIDAPTVREDRDHTWMLYTVQVDHGRDELQATLAGDGIEARVYFIPAHHQPVFADRGAVRDLPVTEGLAERILSLPFHGRMDHEALGTVAEAVAKAR
jgi:dTDP-4-amino-4,6-dideoxygalactose transaminase